ncbi:MAG TPA: phosphatase PAP2 family protein [Steroidobacteraceae bacterium]
MTLKKSRSIAVCLAAITIAALTASPCHADEFNASDVWDDTKLYFTAPLRWDTKDWLYFGGALAAIGGAHAYDASTRRHFAVGERAVLNGQDPNDLRDAIPAAAFVAGTWVVAALIGEPDGRVEAYTMLEAAGFSLITAEGLKVAAGRERPNQTTDANMWREGGSSFPSFHATAAFAVGTVFAESGGDDYRWIRRVLGYGMATATAYQRVHENTHWLSDTVAGAAVGIATAEFTLNRRRTRAHRWELSIAPMAGGGTELSVRITLH